ncbi:MAG TPA: hypothetical protein PK280_07210 [Planctomycetota bacterium]|nr:hypothetical protein [Planctomycetota bacterium]
MPEGLAAAAALYLGLWLIGRIVRRRAFAALSEDEARRIIAGFADMRKVTSLPLPLGMLALMGLLPFAGLPVAAEHGIITAVSFAALSLLYWLVRRRLVRMRAPRAFTGRFLLSRAMATASACVLGYAAYLSSAQFRA